MVSIVAMIGSIHSSSIVRKISPNTSSTPINGGCNIPTRIPNANKTNSRTGLLRIFPIFIPALYQKHSGKSRIKSSNT